MSASPAGSRSGRKNGYPSESAKTRAQVRRLGASAEPGRHEGGDEAFGDSGYHEHAIPGFRPGVQGFHIEHTHRAQEC